MQRHEHRFKGVNISTGDKRSMSIEVLLERIATALETIALRAGQSLGAVPVAEAPVDAPAPSPSPPPPPAATAKSTKAKPALELVEPEKVDEEVVTDSSFLDDEQPATTLTVDDIRSAAVALQKKLGGQEQVRKILEDQGAMPLSGKLKTADQAKLRAVLKALQPKAA